MSTKIYNAFIWNGPGGFDGLMKKLTALRARVFEKSVKVAASHHLNIEKFSLVEYMDDIRSAMKTGLCFTDKGNFNPSSSATIHFHGGKVYVIFFGLPNDWPMPPFSGLVDFHYQNQTDREDGITEKAWSHRRRTWDAIFKKDSRPAHAGLVFEIIDDSDSVALAYDLFKRLHGHSASDDSAKKCPHCIARRSKAGRP